MELRSVSLLILLLLSDLFSCTALWSENIERVDMDTAIGIHLGTTHSSVGVYKHRLRNWYATIPGINCQKLSVSDVVEVIINEQGQRTTPSCVSFTDAGILVGEAAKDQAAFNPQRTICGEIIHLIGKQFDDGEVQSFAKRVPYKVVDIANKPHIMLRFMNDQTQVFSPEEICAFILRKMKEMAEAYLGKEIKRALILAPIDYSDGAETAKQHIKDAGEIAGLDVLRVYNSRRRIAGSAFGLDHVRYIIYLIYDLGGTDFGATIVNTLNDDTASKGDAHLGGDSFDSRVMNHFINLIKNKYKKDISKDAFAVARLRSECEKAKRSLSSMDRVMIKIESLADGVELFEEPLTRETFEELNMDLFNKTIELAVKEAMDDGGVDVGDVDEIVLVGGSTRIPKIRNMLKDLFGKEPLNNNDNVNPEEVGAYVATVFARLLNEDYSEDSGFGFRLNRMSVGIETTGGIMKVLVKSGKCLPTKLSYNVTTYQDAQTTVEINVFEGERQVTKYNHILGRIEISGLKPAPRGVPSIEVSIEVDLYSNVYVTAEDKETKIKKSITIPAKERYLDAKHVREVRSHWYENMLEDKREKTIIEATLRELRPQAYNMGFAIVGREDH